VPVWTGWFFVTLVGAVALLFFVSYIGGSLNAVEFFARQRSRDETLDDSESDDL
jgi:hypothetical protein